MADEILRVDKAQTLDRTSKAIWVQKGGAATPSTYEDEWMLPDDYLAPEQADILQNQTDITDHETRIDTLETLITKVHVASSNSAFTSSQPADSLLLEISFLVLSGTPTVAVGTALGLGDIMSSGTISGTYRLGDYKDYQAALRTLYISVSGGFVATTIIYRTEYFNQ